MPDKLVLKHVDLGQHLMVANPPSTILKRYKITGKKRIVDGPRPVPGDSIDFSPLLTNAEIHRALMNTAFGGGEMDGSVFGLKPAKNQIYTGETLVKNPAKIDIRTFSFGRTIPESLLTMQRDAAGRIYEQTGVIFRSVDKWHPETFTFVMFYPEDQEHARELSLEFHDIANNAPDDSKQKLRNLGKIMGTFADSRINCTGFPSFDENANPLGMLIVIKTGEGYDPSCIYEEMVQSMGLYRDDDSLVSTLFTDRYKYYQRPTELDWLLLKLVYNPRLKNGMTRTQVSPIVKQLLSELRPYGD